MSLQVKINDDFILETDARNFIVKYRFFSESRKNPGEKTENWGEMYFGHLIHAFESIPDKKLQLVEATTLDEIRNIVLELKRDIIQTLTSSGFDTFMRKRDELYPKKEEVLEPATVVSGIKRRGRKKAK